MRALVVRGFGCAPEVEAVRDPAPAADGVVVEVAATGVCRSDWHAFTGHDAGVSLPFVPGHELAGTVVSVGTEVDPWWLGRRVTTPFVCACGTCPACRAGEQQVCVRQSQPGFTHDGSFAELVALRHAAVNLVELGDEVSFEVGALLGCRVATAWRAVHHRGRVRAGQTVVVHGCGGLGLAAVAIAAAAGAHVIAVDPAPGARLLAEKSGASTTLTSADAVDGAHLSLDCAGLPAAAAASIRCLRPRGRHVQVGLLPGGAHLPVDVVVARELDVLGSHGAPAHAYPELLAALGDLHLHRLITRRIGLDDAAQALADVGHEPGITVIAP
ncbi:MAG: alcohol dehydrogenase catalytic domain-containing protein [Mycobacteriaceae bacterium]